MFRRPKKSSAALPRRIRGHPRTIQDQARIAGELAHFFSGAGFVVGMGFQYAGGAATELGDMLRTMVGANAAAAFIVIPVDTVVTGVFDDPAASTDRQDLSGLARFGVRPVMPMAISTECLPDFS